MDKPVTAVIVVVVIVSIIIFVNVITDLSEERPSATSRGLMLFPVLLEHWLFSPPARPQRSQRPTAFFYWEAWHVLVRVASAAAAVLVAVAPVMAAATAAVVVVVSQSDVDGARVLDPVWHRPVCQGLADP